MISRHRIYRKATEEELIKGSSEMILEKEYDIETNFNMEVASWKLKIILTQMNLIKSVEDALNSLPEPNKSIALMAWSQSPTVSSESALAKFVQQAIQLTDEEVYEIFMATETLILEAPSQNRIPFQLAEQKEEIQNGIKTIYKTVLIRKNFWFEKIYEWVINLFKRK